MTVEEFEKVWFSRNDLERLEWLKNNQKHLNIAPVTLDNDCSFVILDDRMFHFNDYLGHGDGVEIILGFAGIEAEGA